MERQVAFSVAAREARAEVVADEPRLEAGTGVGGRLVAEVVKAVAAMMVQIQGKK